MSHPLQDLVNRYRRVADGTHLQNILRARRWAVGKGTAAEVLRSTIPEGRKIIVAFLTGRIR